MTTRNFSLIAGILFLVMAIGHALRLAFHVCAVVGGWMVPTWVSVAAIVVLAYLAYSGLRLSRSGS